jgi:FG-GAP repeat
MMVTNKTLPPDTCRTRAGRCASPMCSSHQPKDRNGVFVSADDVNGDGRFDILIGAGAGSPPTVKVMDANQLYVLTPMAG